MSRVIKSQYTQTDKEKKKVIGLQPLKFAHEQPEEDDLQEETIDLDEVQAQADQILQEAMDQAQQIRDQAEEQAQQVQEQINQDRESWEVEKEQLKEETAREGYDSGYNQGKQEGFQEYKGLIHQAKEVVEQSKHDYHKYIAESEYTILQLAIKSAEKIMKQTLTDDPDSFLSLVQGVIREVKEHSDVTIHIHPEYYDLISTQKEELQMLFAHPETKLYISPDDELDMNSCIIESSFGKIDASVDTQLNEIKNKLIELLDEENQDAGY